MAFTDQEKQLILYGKQNGKSADEITTALAKMRAGIQPTPAPAPETNSVAKDVAIGALKRAGDTVKTTGDLIASAAPSMIAGPVLSAVPHVKSFLTDITQTLKNKIQGAFGLTDAHLQADNTAQKVGKGLELGAEVLSPFIASRLAGLVSRGSTLASAAPKVLGDIGAGDMAKTAGNISKTGADIVKTGIEKTASFVKNPRLALAEANANPQLETSAKRLFLDGTKRLQDPVATYDKYVGQAKKAITDIKVDPPIAQVGNDIGDAFKQVVAQRRAVGATMGEELKKVGTIKTNVADAYTNLDTSLKDAGLQYDATSKKLIPGDTSKMTTEDLSLLGQYVKEFNKLGSTPTVAQIDATIARTQGLVNNFKSAKGITETTNAERLIKQSQAALRDQLDPAKSGNKALTKYAEARKSYADLSNFIDEGAGYLGKITQSGDFSKDASIAKSSVQSILNNGKKDWLNELEKRTGYPALDDAVLALQAMKDAGDFRGASLLESLSQGSIPTSQAGITQKMIDFALSKAARVAAGTPEEQTRVFLNALKEAAQKPTLK